MPPTQTSVAGNRLLEALPRNDRQRLLKCCELVDLKFGEVLCEPGQQIQHVYFPTGSFISLTTTIDACEHMEVALVGNEGMIGNALTLGVEISPLRALVHGQGSAWRMAALTFSGELERSAVLQRLLNRYLCVVFGQLAKLILCTRFHLLEPRLARWLLMTGDRAQADEFHMTHEFLADILGMRRVGITKAAKVLQDRKLISYSRGNIKILDRGGLQAVACSCYQADKAIYAKMLG